jgi:hypothetical protein
MKPCPFCGKTMGIGKYNDVDTCTKTDRVFWKVFCCNFLCGFESWGWAKRKYAIEAANRRTL